MKRQIIENTHCDLKIEAVFRIMNSGVDATTNRFLITTVTKRECDKKSASVCDFGIAISGAFFTRISRLPFSENINRRQSSHLTGDIIEGRLLFTQVTSSEVTNILAGPQDHATFSGHI
ncbi:hypothetical protein CDAR_256871 [Caerostris darwini]|uniref:Uncharacterized protein n=1 Tax=Caerostris darwini TaxID=1538125 RepID=A0AAV4Q2Y6_9ARAC|nr:hypothetical protein CDAR_256871 [Caerostris darwini]